MTAFYNGNRQRSPWGKNGIFNIIKSATHKSSKNVWATSKFYVPVTEYESSFMLRIRKF